MRSTVRSPAAIAGLLMLVATLFLSACGGAAEDEDAIRLQANAVGGGQVYYPDLADQDTVLWFWAPW